MAVDELKNALKHWSNKISYPHARIAFGSRVTGGTKLGAEVSIEKDCYVFGSTLGDNVQIREHCRIFNSELENNIVIWPHTVLTQVRLGSFSYISEQSSMSGVNTGRFCSIGPYFLCGYGLHPINLVSTSPVFYSTRRQCGASFVTESQFTEQQQTGIGHDVWIGARVFVKDGVKIGHGAIVAAGAIVVKDVPNYAIVGGVPAKIIRFRFGDQIINDLLEIQWWNWSEDKLRQAQSEFARQDIESFVAWARQT